MPKMARKCDHPLFHVWDNIRSRCRNPNHPFFPQYGGRGIEICKRWDNFDFFLTDIGERPSGHFLDRIDNDRNYEPGNVRWLLPEESSKNRRKYGAIEKFTTEELL